MESELTAFLATIDTPEFRRNNMTKVRAKAATAQGGTNSSLSVPVPAAESAGFALSMTRLQLAPNRSGE